LFEVPYIRHVKNFTIFLGRSPDQARPEDLRRYQVHQREQRVQPPTMNSAVAALGWLIWGAVRLSAHRLISQGSLPKIPTNGAR
jgi:hypothetical protein